MFFLFYVAIIFKTHREICHRLIPKIYNKIKMGKFQVFLKIIVCNLLFNKNVCENKSLRNFVLTRSVSWANGFEVAYQ